ncbi:MAG: MarR family transcriptional regulator [Clostridia bacterium]|nr:MarR family transcriptional regulator [Clostridia bacterium]
MKEHDENEKMNETEEELNESGMGACIPGAEEGEAPPIGKERGGMGHGPGGEYGMRGPGGHPGPGGEYGMRGPGGHPGPGGEYGMRGPGWHPGPGGEYGMRGPGWHPGPMEGRRCPPRFNRRPAFSPGFEPEAERRERYAGLDTRGKITFQLKALGHILRMLPGTRDGQNRVLSILLEKGTLSQRELMELASIRSASLSELVAKLEMNGYVRRFPNPRDHRSVSVCLTEAGTLAARALMEDRTDLYDGMTDEELAQLLGILEKLAEKWQSMLPGAAAGKAYMKDRTLT